MCVPKIDDPDFLKLEQLIDADFEAIEVMSKPIDTEVALDCFNIVQRRVNEVGGKRILGWQIWKHDFFIEAEAHAVWENPEGVLLDITPKQRGLIINNILFVEDSNLDYQGKRIDNIRMNITKNVLVDDLIKLFKILFHMKNKGDRHMYDSPADRMGEKEKEEFKQMLQKFNDLYKFVYGGNTVKSRCYCLGEKSYKNCHGKDLKRI